MRQLCIRNGGEHRLALHTAATGTSRSVSSGMAPNSRALPDGIKQNEAQEVKSCMKT